MPKILSDLLQLRKKIGGLKAEKKAVGPAYAVKSAKDLMIKLRDAADELHMPLAGAVVHQDIFTEPWEKGTKVTVTSTSRAGLPFPLSRLGFT